MNRDQALFELMARAPAVPSWFEPAMETNWRSLSYLKMSNPAFEPKPLFRSKARRLSDEELQKAYDDARREYDAYATEYNRQRILQWPSYYAREVLKRGEASRPHSRSMTWGEAEQKGFV